MDQPTDGDDPDGGADPARSYLDLVPLPADRAARRDPAQDRARRVGGLLKRLGQRGLLRSLRERLAAEALGRGEVTDPLVRSLGVVPA